MTEKLKYVRGSRNIFADLGFPKGEAENLKMRADLVIRIVDFYKKSGMTQAQAAKTLGLTQPRLNALLKGQIGLYSLDALVNIAAMQNPPKVFVAGSDALSVITPVIEERLREARANEMLSKSTDGSF